MSLSSAVIEAHVHDQQEIVWVPARDLASDRTEACVDGRAVDAVIGTPGGNAGELLLLLAALESTTGHAFSHEQLDSLLDAYLARLGRFYMHGDTHALAELPGFHLGTPAPDDDGARAIAHHLANPPPASRDELLDALCQPDAIGCGHLKLMLTDPEGYGVRRELTEGLLRAFFRALWRGAAVEYVVLSGHHREAAVILVTVHGEISEDGRLPMFKPRVGDRQVFVDHPQAAALLRRWEEEAVAEITGIDVDLDALHAEIEALADRQLDRTLRALAAGLPIFEVRFAGEGSSSFEVIDKGRVPGPDH